MRVEDLDRERSRPELEEEALRDLEWLGLDWYGEVVRQSERDGLYRAALELLDERGLVYPCVCTRREIAAAQRAPHAEESGPAYPGTCRGRFVDAADARSRTGREPALRFRARAGAVAFTDAFAGEYVEEVARTVGDFPVARRDGEPAYQLAVVVDDAEMGVTEVLRGDDLLSSTARQGLLQDALGLPRPRWVHVPLVVDAQGHRLAKRAGGLALGALREAGVEAGEVVRWAAVASGQEDRGPGPPPRYLPGFDLSRLPRAPARTFSAPGR